MAQAFNLTAQLNLRGPSNVRTIVSNIRRQLGTINTNVTVSISANSNRSIATLNRTLAGLNSTLSTTTINANNATAAINSLGQAIAGVVNNSANFNANVTTAANAANTLANNASRVNQQLAPAATEMQEFGRQSALAVRRFAAFSTATAVIFSLTNAIKQGFGAFIDFDRELVRLQQVTGKSSEGLRSLSGTITNLSTDLGVASSELLNVATTFAQAGLSARDTERALKALALSALAPSFDDMNRTVEGSIALMRQFDISAADLEKALGSVNSVSAAFAVEAADLIAAIQRTGGVFASASKGVSSGTDALNEFLAIFTSVRQTTRESAETIATGLRTIFTRIQRGSTIEALKEYGVTLTDAEGKFVGAYKAVELLSQGLSKLDPRDLRFSQIVEELGGFRQIGKVIPLIQQFAVAQNALGVAQKGQDSLAEDAAIAQLSLANQISKVREEFLALIRDISGTDSFKSIVSGALDLTSAMIKVADSVKGVLPVLGVMLAFRGASALRQFGRGFRERFAGNVATASSGGRILGFSKGGTVPGSGRGDKVPALLEPGEVVMSNRAVSRYGRGNLVRMNEYAAGGVSGKPYKKAKGKPFPETDQPTNIDFKGEASEFTHLGNSAEVDFQAGGRKVRLLYTNMGLDLPKSWNRNWATNKKDNYGAFGDYIVRYIKSGKDIFKSLKSGQKIYRFTGRGDSLAQQNLNKHHKTIKEHFVKNIKRQNFLDTDAEVGQTLPNILIRSIKSSINDKESRKSIIDGLQEISAFKEQGSNTRQAVTEEMRSSKSWNKAKDATKIKTKKSIGGEIQRLVGGGTVEEIASSKGISVQQAVLEQLQALGGGAGIKQILGASAGSSLARKALRKDSIESGRYLKEATDFVNRALSAKGTDDAAEQLRISKLTKVAVAGLLPIGYSKNFEWQLGEGAAVYASVRGLADRYKEAVAKMQQKTSAAASEFAEDMQYADIFGSGTPLAFDFDETLVSGTDILDKKGKPDIARYSDRATVEQYLAKGRPTRLLSKLKSLIDADPEFIKKTRILTARPQSTVDLLAKSLQSFGLPYTAKDITGVGGLGMNVAKGKAANLRELEKLIDDNLENVKTAKAAGKQAFLYSEPKRIPDLDEIMGQGNIEGAIIEKALAELGANLPPIETLEANRSIDFPRGLGRAAQFFGVDPDVPTEVKRTLDRNSFEKARAEFARYFTEGPSKFSVGGLVQAFEDGSPYGVKDRSTKNRRRGAYGQRGFVPLNSREYEAFADQAYAQAGPYGGPGWGKVSGVPMPKALADYAAKINRYVFETGGAGLSIGKKLVKIPDDIDSEALEALKEDLIRQYDGWYSEIEEVLPFGRSVAKQSSTPSSAKDARVRAAMMAEAGNKAYTQAEDAIASFKKTGTLSPFDPAIDSHIKSSFPAYIRELESSLKSETDSDEKASIQRRLKKAQSAWPDYQALLSGTPVANQGRVTALSETLNSLLERYGSPVSSGEVDNIIKAMGSKLLRKNLGGLIPRFVKGGRADYYSLEKSSGLSSGEFDGMVRYAKTNDFSLDEFKSYLSKRAADKKSRAGSVIDPKSLQSFLMHGAVGSRLGTGDLTEEQKKLAAMLKGPPDPQYDPNRFAKGGKALPTVHDIGEKLSSEFNLTKGKTNAWNQLENNCLQIANKAADMFGYESSEDKVRRYLTNFQQIRVGKQSPAGFKPTPEVLAKSPMFRKLVNSPASADSTGNIVVREGEELMRHVSFEHMNKEYNFGAAGPNWPIVLRIPLKKKKEIEAAYGGLINRFANGGSVPALVSNGEAYVPPKLAKRIGYGKLNRMNQADRNGMGRFSEGGISVFKGPGTGTSDSIPTSLPVGSFILREKATKALGLSQGGFVQRFKEGGRSDTRGASATGFGGSTKLFTLLDKTLFKLVGAFGGLTGQTQRTEQVERMLQAEAGDLLGRLQQNSAAYNRSGVAHTAVAEQLLKQVDKIKKSSQNQAVINARLNMLRKSIDDDTAAKNNSASMSKKLSKFTYDTIAGSAKMFGKALSLAGGVITKGARGVLGGRNPSAPSATTSTTPPLLGPFYGPHAPNRAANAARYEATNNAADSRLSTARSRRRAGVSDTGDGEGNRTRNGMGLGNLGMGLSFAVPMLADMFSNDNPLTAEQASQSAMVQSGATSFGTALMTGQMVGAINPLLGVFAGLATGAYGLMKAFADADEAARKFKIDKAQKDIENNGEIISDIFKEIGDSSKATPNQLAKLNTALQKSIQSAIGIVNETGVGSQRGSVIQTLSENFITDYLTGGSGQGGQQGANNRSIILQEKGTLAYLGALLDTNAELRHMQALLPRISIESSKQFKVAAQQVEDVLSQRLKSGESISDIISEAGFDQQAEILARSNAAIQEQLLSVQSDTRLSQQERDARIKNIIALEGNRIALEKAKQVQLELALKDLENASNQLSYSVRRIFSNMNDAVASSVLSLKELDTSLKDTSDALSGNAKSSSGTGINKVIEILQSPRGFDQNQRQQAFSTASSSFGSFGPQLNKILEIGATLEDSVLGTINRTISNSNKDTTNEAVGSQVSIAIQKKLKDIGLPPGLSDKLSSEIGRQVSELRKSGDTSIDFSDLVEKIPQLGKAIDLVKDTTSALTDRMKFLQNAFGQLSEATNRVIDLQIDSNSRFTNSQKTLIDGNIALKEALGQNVSLQEKTASIRLSTTNLTGGQTDPAGIRRNIEQFSRDRDNAVAAKGQAEAVGDVKSVLDFENSIRQSSIAINENVTALKAMADNSELASAAMSQLQKAQERQRAGTSVLERLVTSTPQQLNELNRSAARLSANMSGMPVMGTTSEQRSQDLELFNMIAPLLGEAANPLKANVLQSMLQQSGVGMTPMFQQILDTMRNPQADPQQAEAIRVYNEAISAQSAANTELAKLNNTLANRIADETAKAIFDAINSAKVKFDDAQLADILNNINNPSLDQPQAVPAQGKARGGLIYKAVGGTIFKPKGTDTVPAMLTPGEFVVNRSATQKNLPLLKSINNGYSQGGKVQYKAAGGLIGQTETNWAKELDDKEKERNKVTVSESPLPYVNPAILDPTNRKFLQKYVGGYVANFTNKKNYTENIVGNILDKDRDEIARRLENVEVDIQQQSIKEWIPGRGPDIFSTYTKASEIPWYERTFMRGADKFPKFSLNEPRAGGSRGFQTLSFGNLSNGIWGGGMPNESLVSNAISSQKAGLPYVQKPKNLDLEQYSKSKFDVTNDAYSLQGQLTIAKSIEAAYDELKNTVSKLPNNTTGSASLKPSDLALKQQNFRFMNAPILANPNASVYDDSKSMYALSPVSNTSVTETKGKSRMLGALSDEKDSLAIDDFDYVGPNMSYLIKDTSNIKSGIDTALVSIRDAINQYVFLKDKPEFFKSFNSGAIATSTLETQLKQLTNGGFGGLFVKVPKNTLNEEWQNKVGDDMALYISQVSDSWDKSVLDPIKDPTKGLEFANLKFARNTSDFAEVGKSKYAWSSMGASSNIASLFKGIADTQSRLGLENTGTFKIGPKTLTTFDTGLFANNLLDGLGGETLKGVFNVQEIDIPSMTRANGYIPDENNRTNGVLVSNGFVSDNINPFINTDLANKELYFSNIDLAKDAFNDYYKGLIKNNWNKQAKAVDNEIGMANLNALIKPQGDISFLPKGQQDLAREKMMLGPQFLAQSLSDMVGPLLSKAGGEIASGPSADVSNAIPFDVSTINKVVQGIIQPIARNIIAVGGKLSPLRDIGAIGTYAQSLLQGANFIGSKVNNISSPFARTYGQLSALGNILSLASKGDVTGINRALGMNLGEQDANIDDPTQLISAIRSYGEFITEQGKLSFGGNAQAVNQAVDKNLQVPGTTQTIAEIFKSGKVELADVDAAKGTFESKKASEAQAPQTVLDVGKMVLNPYNVFADGIRKNFNQGLTQILQQAGYVNAIAPINSVVDYLSNQDSYLNDTKSTVQNPADPNTLNPIQKNLLLLTGGAFGLIPDKDKLDAIKATRAARSAEQPQQKARGGLIYASNGTLVNFAPKGTDTVPAMLTPGEFVINRKATQKHLPVLKAINDGYYDRGGLVSYFNRGGIVIPKYFSEAGAVNAGANRSVSISPIKVNASEAARQIQDSFNSAVDVFSQTLQNFGIDPESLNILNSFSSVMRNLVNNLSQINITPEVKFTGRIAVDITGAAGLSDAAESLVNDAIKNALQGLKAANNGSIELPSEYE